MEIERQKSMSSLLNSFYRKAEEEAPALNIWSLIEERLPERKNIGERIADFFSPLFAIPKFRYAAATVAAAFAVAFFSYQIYTPPQPAELARGVEINYIESNKAQVMVLDTKIDHNNNNNNTAVIWIFEEESSNGSS